MRCVHVAYLASIVLVLAAPAAHGGELRVGDPMLAVTLPDWQGRPVNLAELRGKVVVVDFWASWCQPCRQALPALDALSRAHAAAGLAVVAINIDKNVAAADRFLAERLPQPSLTLLRDPEATTLARCGANGMPTLYLVDRRGVVQLVEAGYAPDRLVLVEQRIIDLLRR